MPKKKMLQFTVISIHRDKEGNQTQTTETFRAEDSYTALDPIISHIFSEIEYKRGFICLNICKTKYKEKIQKEEEKQSA